MNTNQIFLSYE